MRDFYLGLEIVNTWWCTIFMFLFYYLALKLSSVYWNSFSSDILYMKWGGVIHTLDFDEGNKAFDNYVYLGPNDYAS